MKHGVLLVVKTVVVVVFVVISSLLCVSLLFIADKEFTNENEKGSNVTISDTLVIRGRIWKLVYAEMEENWGLCDEPTDPNRKIYIHPELKGTGKLELEIEMHEFLHAAFWDIDEEVIGEVAKNYSEALWQLGYRKIDTSCLKIDSLKLNVK